MAADTITRGRLRRLAELRPERGRVLSVFFNLDPSEFATPAARATEVNSVVTAAAHKVDEAEGLEHDERRRCAPTSSACARCSSGSDVATNGTHGLAVFACGPADLLEVVRLPHPIESRAVVDAHPCVEPLVRSGTGRALVRPARQPQDGADLHRHGGRPGGGRPASRTTRTASTTRAAGRRRATSAPSSRRSSTTSADALDTLFARFKRRPFDHLLVGAPDELVARGRASGCTRTCASALAGRLHVDVENSSAEDVRAAAARGRRRARRGGRARGARPHASRASAAATAASSGLAAVMEALEQARVEILLLAEDFDAPELDEALEKAITQSARGPRRPPPRRPDPHGGIGAVLRFWLGHRARGGGWG